MEPELADIFNQPAQLRSQLDSLADALCELAKSGRDIVVIDADASNANRTDRFAAEYPDRFIQVGISEQDAVGIAAGLALDGKIPFVVGYAAYTLERAIEQIRTLVCIQGLNVKIVGTHSGASMAESGPVHQCYEDVALARSLASMGVVVPCDNLEAQKAVLAVAETSGPFYVRLSSRTVPTVTTEATPFAIGQAELYKQGDHITLMAAGTMVFEALRSARTLDEKGISTRVVNCHTVRPMDEAMIERVVDETGGIVTIEEANRAGGLGSAVVEACCDKLPVPVARVGVDERFGERATRDLLMDELGLSPRHIIRAVSSVMSRKRTLSRR
jgi:transketolase